MAITTAMTTSFKKELLQAGHCFNPTTVITTVTAGNGTTAVTAMSSLVGVAIGMPVTGTGIAANTIVAAVGATNTMTLSANTTASISAAAITVSGDIFKMALIKTPVIGTFDATATNYGTGSGSPTGANLGTDEVTNSTGTGYTAGGLALGNVIPTTGNTVAFINFSPNPSWTTASFSTAGCMIYNSSSRMSPNRVCSVHDFGGAQQVSSGTFTVLMPNPDSSSAILRIA